MDEITLVALRQILQNCGSALRAQDFKALLDYIWQVNAGMYDGLFMGIASPNTNPTTNPNFKEGRYGWYITHTVGNYINFPDSAETNITVSIQDVTGKFVILKSDGSLSNQTWMKYIIPVSDLNQTDVLHTTGGASNKVMSQAAITNLFNTLQSQINTLTTEINRVETSINNRIDSLQREWNNKFDNILINVNTLTEKYAESTILLTNVAERMNSLEQQMLDVRLHSIKEAPFTDRMYVRYNGAWLAYGPPVGLGGAFDDSFDNSFANEIIPPSGRLLDTANFMNIFNINPQTEIND